MRKSTDIVVVPPELARCLCLLELVRNVPFGCQGKLPRRCLPGGTLHKTSLPEKMQLLATEYCWLPCKTLVLEEPTCTTGTVCWTETTNSAEACQTSTPEPGGKILFLRSLAPGLFNVMPANKEKIVKGPRCVLKEKGKRLNLKIRGNKLINGTVIF